MTDFPEYLPACRLLQAIVAKPGLCHAWGERNALLDAVREILCLAPARFRGTTDQVDVLARVRELAGTIIANPAPWLSHYPATASEQRKLLVLGVAYVAQAACVVGQEFDVESARVAINCFNKAWPLPPAPRPLPQAAGDYLLDRFSKQFGEDRGAGFWVVLDLLDRLKVDPVSGSRPQRKTPNVSSASMPVLLYCTIPRGARVARLTVELVRDQAGGFLPDPWGLGMTAVAQADAGFDPAAELAPDDFFASMQRAWLASGLANRGCRARWQVTSYDPGDDQNYLAVPVISGRSCEAAACVALWAAYGGIPAANASAAGELRLDDGMSISASIVGDCQGPREQLELGPVDRLPEKLEAAQGAKLTSVLVSDPLPAIIANNALARPGRTLVEAFNQLLAYNRAIRKYQESVVNKWIADWPDLVGDDGLKELRREQKEK